MSVLHPDAVMVFRQANGERGRRILDMNGTLVRCHYLREDQSIKAADLVKSARIFAGQ